MEKYHIQEEEQIFSPSLIYYKDILIKNMKKSIKEAGGAKHLWPHIKSHKMTEVLKLQIEMGITRFKCATLEEAETAALAGGHHILLAYPLVGPNQGRFLELMKRWPDRIFYAIGDDLKQLKHLADQATVQNMTVNVYIDVNTGMNRTGVGFDSLEKFGEALSEIRGIKMAGFHCYDGNRHEKDFGDRHEKVRKTIEEIKRMQQNFGQIYHCEPETFALILGGSPTFPCYAQSAEGENIFYSPGTVFIYDVGYQEQFPDLSYEPGAAVLTRVVSHPAKGYFTIDCGYKAISAEQVCPGVLLGVPHAIPMFQSEEHWTFAMEPGYEQGRPAIGQILYVMPWHICPTTALYDEVVVVSHKKVQGTWQVNARKRLTGFLS